MLSFHTITWDNKPVTGEVVSLVGEVVKINRSTSTTTNVTGGGGSVRTTGGSSGYTHPLYAGLDRPKTDVRIKPVKVMTKSTFHDDVYLIDSTGKEHFIQFTDRPELGIREGHQLQLLSINADVAGEKLFAPNVAIKNKSLDKVFYDHLSFAPIQTYKATQVKLAKRYFMNLPTIKKVLFSVYLLIILMCMIFPPLGILVALPLIFVMVKNLKSLNKKFEDEFNHDVVPALQKAMI